MTAPDFAAAFAAFMTEYQATARGEFVLICTVIEDPQICVQAPDLAMEHEGETVYPACFRDSSGLRAPEAELEAEP